VNFADAVGRLESGFRAGLPGPDAQARLSPVPRRAWPEGFNPARVRNAAGLILVYPKEHTASAQIILTVRADGLRHGGQVSLPGGVVDPGETFEQAALREAHEEVALAPEQVRVLGALTPLDIPVSGFRLHPIVAVQSTRPHLTASDGEVARILEISVGELMDPAHFVITTRDAQGKTFSVPAFRVAHVDIWGATAMVLAEFLTLLGWSPVSR
jgi:8-oxo-dGTP pyrophosphatase MutT (NUDIX family)